MATKTVQISTTLLYDLFAYFLTDQDDDDREYTREAITTALEAKLEALTRRELYTQSKTADTPEAREAARQAYLNRVGMRQSYRWPAGYKPDEPPAE